MRGRPPSPVVVRARELATPTTTAPQLVAQLQTEGLTLDARAARAIAHAARPPVAGETADQRIAETRALLLRLAGERTLDGPSWRQIVAGKLDISLSAVSKAYRKGVSLATRERWLRTVYAPTEK